MSVWVAQPPPQKRDERAISVTTRKLLTGQSSGRSELAVQHEEMSTPVLLPAVLVRLPAQGQLFTIADRRKPFGRHAQGHQVVSRRSSPLGTKGQIIFD